MKLDPQRLKFAEALAHSIPSKAGSGGVLAAVIEAVGKLTDVPRGHFTVEAAQRIGPKCSQRPTEFEIRTLLLDGSSPLPIVNAKPMAEFLINRILDECGDRPGPLLASEFSARGHDLNAILAERARQRDEAKQDWSDPQKVAASAKRLAGHPMEHYLGKMLYGLVHKHAPQNLGWIPPKYHPMEKPT